MIEKNKRGTEQLIFSILQEDIDEKTLLNIKPFQWLAIEQSPFFSPACLIIYSLLKKRNLLSAIPREIREKWQGRYYNNLTRNILALEQITEIQNALKEAGIKLILLKGLSLISTIYDDLGVRSFADIDLLVRKEELQGLKNKLEQLGYCLQSPERAVMLERFGCGDWVFLREGSLPLDVHWQLCQYERLKGIIKFDEQRIFQDAVPIQINNNQLLSMSKEDLFLYLSMHLALVHGFSGFSWFYDLRSVIGYYRDSFDWDLLIDKARESNLATAVYYVLCFCKELFNIDFFSEITKQIEPSFAKRSLLYFLIPQKNISSLSSLPARRKSYYIAHGLLMDGPANIIRVFVRMILPSEEWLSYHYGKVQGKNRLRFSCRLRHFLSAFSDTR